MSKITITLPASLHSAWYNLDVDWLIWMLVKTNQIDSTMDFALQLALLEMPLIDGKRVIDLVTHPDSLNLIKMKKQHIAGKRYKPMQWSVSYNLAKMGQGGDDIKTRHDLAVAYAHTWISITESMAGDVARSFAWYSPRDLNDNGKWDVWGDSEAYSYNIARELQADIVRNVIKLEE